MDFLPLELLFILSAILLYLAMYLGTIVGNSHTKNEKKLTEKITSSNATSILGLLAFILVFTFGIVYSRYDSKRDMVREEANLIRNAWLRSEFLPDQDRLEASKIFRRYTDMRIDAAKGNIENIGSAIFELNKMQKILWDMAVINARKDMNSDVAALYIESLNEMINQQASRIAVGLQARIPLLIWILLYLMMIFGMFCMGYEAAVNGSSRNSWLTPIMVLSLSLMITVIAALDRSDSSLIKVSQQPIEDMRNWMDTQGK